MVTGGVLLGPEVRLVGVEVSVRGGLPGLEIVGLADRAVQEGGRRLRSALAASGHRLPPRQIVVGLSPAELPKHGVSLDLAIAVALLEATGRPLPNERGIRGYWGQVGLDGSVLPAPGVLCFALAARSAGIREIIVAPADAGLANLSGIRVGTVGSIGQFLADGPCFEAQPGAGPLPAGPTPSEVAFASIAGMRGALRAALVAAAGGHHCAFFGPPGAGKTLVARAVHALLPPMDDKELVETVALAAINKHGTLPAPVGPELAARPLREPLPGISQGALVGRGRPYVPGELTLAHRGILLLDELPHHRHEVLAALCVAMDHGWVEVKGEAGIMRLPARAQVVATSNLCACGRTGSLSGGCVCSSAAKAAFWRHLSGPLLDRLDLQVEVSGPELLELELAGAQAPPTLPGEAPAIPAISPAAAARLGSMRAQAAAARQRAASRRGHNLDDIELADPAWLTDGLVLPAARTLLAEVHRGLGLSARGYLAVLRVARTVADLAGHTAVGPEDVAEAASYRARLGPPRG